MSLPAPNVVLLCSHGALTSLGLSHPPKKVGQRWARKAQSQRALHLFHFVPPKFEPYPIRF